MSASDFIPVNEPLLDGNEKKYLAECIDTGWISSEGPFVQRFEEAFAARVGRRHGIAVCNGTAALDAAFAAVGLGPGDEVILPTFTIISCIQQIVRAGATPVLVDADPQTWNMDVTQIAARITPRTKAILVVHIYGLPVDMDPVLALAERHGLKVIEDAAEAIGQTYRPFFWPMHEQPVLRRMGLFEGERFPVAERLARRGLYVPSGVALMAAQRDRVVMAIHNLLSR